MDAVKVQADPFPPDPRDAIIADLRARNAQLESRIAELEAKIVKLEALLDAATRAEARRRDQVRGPADGAGRRAQKEVRLLLLRRPLLQEALRGRVEVKSYGTTMAICTVCGLAPVAVPVRLSV